MREPVPSVHEMKYKPSEIHRLQGEFKESGPDFSDRRMRVYDR